MPLKDGAIASLHYLFVLSRPSVDRMVPSVLSVQTGALSRNILRDTPRSNTSSALWASFSLVKLTQEINHKAIRFFLPSSVSKASFAGWGDGSDGQEPAKQV